MTARSSKRTRGLMHTIPAQMSAALLIGHGGLDKLEYRTDVPVPEPADDEVLIEVGAAGVNKTDINTRLGGYSKSVDATTNVGGAEGLQYVSDDDGGWSGAALEFPRIQGADVAGRIVAVFAKIAEPRLGARLMVRNMLRHDVNR